MLSDFSYHYIQFPKLNIYHASQHFFAVPQNDIFNFKNLNDYEVFVDIRSHWFVIETWVQFRRPRSINLGNWKKRMSINLRGFRDIYTVHIYTINISTEHALDKLQLMKNIQILHVSAQSAILREFLTKSWKRYPGIETVGLNICHEFYFIKCLFWLMY